jgi:hypothetical protein
MLASLLAIRKGSSNAGCSSDIYISYSRVTGSVKVWNTRKEENGKEKEREQEEWLLMKGTTFIRRGGRTAN